MVDPIGALVAWLRAAVPLGELVEGRVYGGELPREQVGAMPRPAVVLRPAGGGLFGRAYQEVGDVRVDVDCYGSVPLEAWQVYLAAYEALKHLRREVVVGVLLHCATPSSKGVLARDPDTNWPVCLSSYQLLAAEVPAA